jgi:hypothetical protein
MEDNQDVVPAHARDDTLESNLDLRVSLPLVRRILSKPRLEKPPVVTTMDRGNVTGVFLFFSTKRVDGA